MREKYLGDSYDLVKRFWAESLSPVGRLLAHPGFIPAEMRAQYTLITNIPMLDSLNSQNIDSRGFGLLMDPDTGIPLPVENLESPTPKSMLGANRNAAASPGTSAAMSA